MSERIEAEAIHVVAPDAFGEHDLDPELESLAGDRYVVVCRRGGHPSIFELAWAMLRRKPIEPVTLLIEEPVEEGEVVDATVEETSIAGVYRAL